MIFFWASVGKADVFHVNNILTKYGRIHFDSRTDSHQARYCINVRRKQAYQTTNSRSYWCEEAVLLYTDRIFTCEPLESVDQLIIYTSDRKLIYEHFNENLFRFSAVVVLVGTEPKIVGWNIITSVSKP